MLQATPVAVAVAMAVSTVAQLAQLEPPPQVGTHQAATEVVRAARAGVTTRVAVRVSPTAAKAVMRVNQTTPVAAA